MANYQDMVNRIADEIGMRTDLTSQIQNAILTAIQHQDNDRYYFNETQTTFSTIVGQSSYSTLTVLGTYVAAMDWLKIQINGNYRYHLSKWDYQRLDEVDTNPNWQNMPYAWAYYQQQIRLFPVPQLIYPVTVFYIQKFPALVNPTDENPWTNDAEEMIRSFAKADLYSNVLLAEANAQQLADRMVAIGKAAKKTLREETVAKTSSGRVRATRF